MGQTTAILLALALTVFVAPAEAQFAESLVRTPTLRPPEAASVAGAYAKTAFGAAQLARGTFSLPGPFVLPGERAAPGVELMPGYAPENGLTEWGLGWAVRLEIRRFRAVGQLGFDDGDDLDTPWGRALRGADGRYYVRGLASRVVVRQVAGDLEAIAPDGTRFGFSRSAGIESARGVYQWNLVRVESAAGDLTTLTWEKNRFRRPFLRTVQYGARATRPAQVEIRYAYEPVDALLADYRAEQLLRLLERVKTVEVRVRHASRGTFEVRWAYALGYEDDPAGPAFYLTRVQRQFASGEQDPAFTYRYDRGFPAPAQLVPSATSVLDRALSTFGPAALMPQFAGRADRNADGVSELEHHADHDELRFDGEGLSVVPLPRDGSEDPLCRPARAATNPVRTAVRLLPGDEEPRVLHFLARATETDVRVCDRQGHLLQKTSLSGSFSLTDPNLTLGDVNRDGRPDLVRVFGGGYQLILNESDGHTYRFRALAAERVEGSISPNGAFARDMNGDGHVDIVVRHANGLAVLFGQGNLSFARQPFAMTFRSASGTPFSPSGYAWTFFDGNRDGLEDLVLSSGGVAVLFGNRGREFVEQPAPALRTLAPSGYPLVDDLTGSGELTLYQVAQGAVQSVALTRPSSGLMTVADDGRGTRLTFDYARAKPEAGTYYSPVVLSALTQYVSGQDTITHRYELAEPVVHPVTHALIGYGSVAHHEPLRTERVRFHHDDKVDGVLVDAEEAADGETLRRFVHRDYEERTFEGIRHMRITLEESGLRGADGKTAASRSVHNQRFDAELCVAESTESTVHGRVHRVRQRATPSELNDTWHCLVERETTTGYAPDGAPQFEHGLALAHDARGFVTNVRALSADEEVDLQHLGYDAEHRLESVTEAGKGTTRYSYDAATGMLRGTETPERVESLVSAFDPVTDAILEMQRDRGDSRYLASYRSDGRERLRAAWDSVTGGSEVAPSLMLAYRDATLDAPAVVARTESLGGGLGEVRSALYFTADGQSIAHARRDLDAAGKDQLVFSDVVHPHRATGERAELRLAPLRTTPDGLFAPSYGVLRAGDELARERSSGLGFPSEATRVVQHGVRTSTVTTRTAEAGGVLTTTTENGRWVRTVLSDLDGNVLARTDEEGFTTRMAYDALGRLTRVTLPSGEVEERSYDALGRLERLRRDGVGETVRHYLFGTTLLEEESYRDELGRLERTALYQYDHAGRMVDALYTLASTGEQEHLRYEYDGKIDGVERYAGQRGHLTRVWAPDVERLYLYDDADRLTRSELVARDFRRIVESRSYLTHGADATRTIEVRDAEDELLERIRQDHRYDTYGRQTHLEVNGLPLFELRYGDRGELDHVTTARESVYFHYDPVTERERGVTHVMPEGVTALGWEYDARGRVASEDYGIDDGASRVRTYVHSPRGLLTHVDDGAFSEGYDYDAIGRRSRVSDAQGARDQARSPGAISLGNANYDYDTLGRLSARRTDLAFSEFRYGARGQLSEAFVSDATLSFAYDHENRRVLKKRNGVPVAVYAGDAYLDEVSVVLPVRIGGRVLGLLVDGAFEPVVTDLRGSAVRVAGRVDVPGAYGLRDARLAHAAALDYAAHGYDADLGLVRMGVRDYDPSLGEFSTPDPLFLASLERCAETPLECNLYGYAKGDPTSFVDATGLAATGANADDRKIVPLRVADVVGRGEGFHDGATGAALGVLLFNYLLADQKPTAGDLTALAGTTQGLRLRSTRDAAPILGVKEHGQSPHAAPPPSSTKGKETTRFVSGVRVEDRRTGNVLEGTVDLGPTLDRIASGGSHPHRNDGSVFKNRPAPGKTTPELPVQPPGYYKEYVHPTPGVSGPGPQRVVVGQGGEMFYTPDHYETFVPLK